MEKQGCTVYEIIRDLSLDECFWLEEPIKKGTIVFEYNGYTYGCITEMGIAVSMIPNKTPFFEVPLTSIQKKRKDNICELKKKI